MTMPKQALPPSFVAAIDATQTCKVNECTQTSTCPDRFGQINCLSLISNGTTPLNLAPLSAKIPSVASAPLPSSHPFQCMNFPSPFISIHPREDLPDMQPVTYTRYSFPADPVLWE